MPRYIEQLTENITPATGDWLWIVDVDAGATDQDRKLSVGKLALLATANTFTAKQSFSNMISFGSALERKIDYYDDGSSNSGVRSALGVIIDTYIAAASDALTWSTYTGSIATPTYTERMRLNTAGNFLIGTATDSGKLTVDQSASAGAIPVLVLDQADLSEEFIEFAGTVGTGNSIEAKAAKTLTTTHFLRMNITGVGYVYMPVGTIA